MPEEVGDIMIQVHTDSTQMMLIQVAASHTMGPTHYQIFVMSQHDLIGSYEFMQLIEGNGVSCDFITFEDKAEVGTTQQKRRRVDIADADI